MADSSSSDPLLAHLQRFAEGIAALVRADPLAREAARRFGAWLLQATEAPEVPSEQVMDRASLVPEQADLNETSASVSDVAIAPPPLQDIELHMGGQRQSLQVPGTLAEAEAARQALRPGATINGWIAPASAPSSGQAAASGFVFVPRRCAVKADGCQWAARYRERWEINPTDDADRRASYENIITRARALPNCYVWATNPKLSVPSAAVMQQFEQGYRNLGLAAELGQRLQAENGVGDAWKFEAYCLLAEAQSAIRAALDREGLFVDGDQESTFWWLRTRTYEDRLLVPRYMKLDDPADLAGCDDLRQRLEALRARMDMRHEQDSQRKSLLNKARYHGRLLREGKSSDEASDWRRLTDATETLLNAGLAPSSLEVRDLLAPLIDAIPERLELPEAFQRAIESVDRYLSTREAETPEEVHPRAVSAEVAEVADLLQGTMVVLIGGERRPQSQRALEREFRLAELRWESAFHHQSHYTFESAIARPETSLVLLAIRWSSHSFENVKALCEKHGKPFVRLPGGYNPNQVASQILAQVGETLASSARPA